MATAKVAGMKWEYIGTGLAFVGVGVTMMLAVPPPWWAKMPTQLVHLALVVGAILIFVGVVFIIIGIWPSLFVYIYSVVCATIGGSMLIAAIFLFIWAEPPKPSFPRLLVDASPQTNGPYGVWIVNDSEDPYINMTVGIRNAGVLARNGFAALVGDIETGLSGRPQIPGLNPGYYQVDMSYRGGRITQMLLISFRGGILRQASMFTNNSGLVQNFESDSPPIPIYEAALTKREDDHGGVIERVRILAPSFRDGIHIETCSFFSRALTRRK